MQFQKIGFFLSILDPSPKNDFFFSFPFPFLFLFLFLCLILFYYSVLSPDLCTSGVSSTRYLL